MTGDPRLLFVVKALHCLVEADEGLEPNELDGLKQVIEAAIIDRRNSHEQKQGR